MLLTMALVYWEGWAEMGQLLRTRCKVQWCDLVATACAQISAPISDTGLK